jgi:hypothetical protein
MSAHRPGGPRQPRPLHLTASFLPNPAIPHCLAESRLTLSPWRAPDRGGGLLFILLATWGVPCKRGGGVAQTVRWICWIIDSRGEERPVPHTTRIDTQIDNSHTHTTHTHSQTGSEETHLYTIQT